MVLPINKKIRFLFHSDDVIHAWWVPELAVKQDAIPGFINDSWAIIEERVFIAASAPSFAARTTASCRSWSTPLPPNTTAGWR